MKRACLGRTILPIPLVGRFTILGVNFAATIAADNGTVPEGETVTLLDSGTVVGAGTIIAIQGPLLYSIESGNDDWGLASVRFCSQSEISERGLKYG